LVSNDFRAGEWHSFVQKQNHFLMLNRRTFLGFAGILGSPLLQNNAFAASEAHNMEPLLAKPTLDNSYWYLGHLLSVLLSAEKTGGLLALLKVTEIKGLEPPPHTHIREDEIFYLLNGEIEFRVGGKTYKAASGDCMFLPRNMEHSFSVLTEQSDVMMLLTPGGFEKYFIEMSEKAPELKQPPRPSGPPDIPRLIATAKKYGIQFPANPG
jgi:quercetin dioxygenase-like cupin family protein